MEVLLGIRNMVCTLPDGTTVPVRIEIGQPAPATAPGGPTGFACTVQAFGFGDETVHQVNSGDELGAVHFALCLAGKIVSSHPMAPRLDVAALPNYGFPLMPAASGGGGGGGGLVQSAVPCQPCGQKAA